MKMLFSIEKYKRGDIVKFHQQPKNINYDDWFGIPENDPVDEFMSRNDGVFAFSIIIKTEPLRHDLIEDPDYCKITHHVSRSKAEIDAIDETFGKFRNDSDYLKIAKKLGIPLVKSNEPDAESMEREVLDAFYKYEEILAMYRAIRREIEMAPYRYDEKKDDYVRIRSKKEIARNRARILKKMLYPGSWSEYKRIYNMPKPLNIWDSRNVSQQYFFFFSKDKFEYSIGSACSSGGRANYSHFSNVCYRMQQLKKFCGTFIVNYDSTNALRMLGYFPKLFVGDMPCFSSNYNRKVTEDIPFLKKDNVAVNSGEKVVAKMMPRNKFRDAIVISTV